MNKRRHVEEEEKGRHWDLAKREKERERERERGDFAEGSSEVWLLTCQAQRRCRPSNANRKWFERCRITSSLPFLSSLLCFFFFFFFTHRIPRFHFSSLFFSVSGLLCLLDLCSPLLCLADGSGGGEDRARSFRQPRGSRPHCLRLLPIRLQSPSLQFRAHRCWFPELLRLQH